MIMAGEYEIESRFNKEYSLVSRRIIRMLSQNSRVSITNIAAQMNLSRPTAKLRLASVQKALGIRYTLELDERSMGFASPYLISVKFTKKPDYGKIKELLQRSYIPQIAFSTEGSYDMIIYANAFSTSEYAHWDKGMRILLGEYGANWRPSEVVHRQLGFFPIRNEAIDRARIAEKYKPLLKLLNENSKLSFQSLSKALGMHFNTVKYNYNKLVELGYVKRPTITMDLTKGVSFMTFFSNYTPVNGYESSSATARLAFMSDDDTSLINRYLICAPLIGSYDFFTMGAFDSYNAAYKADILYHKRAFSKHNVKIAYGTVKELILGRLPIRSVDTRAEYNKIVWNPDFNR